MRTVFNYFDVGGKLPSAQILLNENVPFTSPFFLFVLWCFTLEQLSRAIYLPLLLPFYLIHTATFVPKVWKRAAWHVVKEVEVNSCDRRECRKQLLTYWKKGRPWFLTISVSSHRLWPWVMEAIAGGKKGWDAGRSGMKAVDTGEGKNWHNLSEMVLGAKLLPLFLFAKQDLPYKILQCVC